jgi:hypothetical protein
MKSIIRLNRVGKENKYDTLDFEKTVKEFNEGMAFSSFLFE